MRVLLLGGQHSDAVRQPRPGPPPPRLGGRARRWRWTGSRRGGRRRYSAVRRRGAGALGRCCPLAGGRRIFAGDSWGALSGFGDPLCGRCLVLHEKPHAHRGEQQLSLWRSGVLQAGLPAKLIGRGSPGGSGAAAGSRRGPRIPVLRRVRSPRGAGRAPRLRGLQTPVRCSPSCPRPAVPVRARGCHGAGRGRAARDGLARIPPLACAEDEPSGDSRLAGGSPPLPRRRGGAVPGEPAPAAPRLSQPAALPRGTSSLHRPGGAVRARSPRPRPAGAGASLAPPPRAAAAAERCRAGDCPVPQTAPPPRPCRRWSRRPARGGGRCRGDAERCVPSSPPPAFTGPFPGSRARLAPALRAPWGRAPAPRPRFLGLRRGPRRAAH